MGVMLLLDILYLCQSGEGPNSKRWATYTGREGHGLRLLPRANAILNLRKIKLTQEKSNNSRIANNRPWTRHYLHS